MAYTSIASFSWSEGGDSWTADIEVNGASSASNTARLLHPIVRRIGKEKMNPLNPIVPTRLETRIFDENRDIWGYIDSNDADDIAIVVKKNSTIWHVGTLDRVQGGERLRRDNPELTLVWDNGLPTLRGKSFDEQEKVNLRETLRYLLDSTPDDLDSRSALAFRHPDATTNRSDATGFSLDHMGNGADYWDVLSQILRKFNMQIWQVKDSERWLALQRSYRDGSYDWEQRATDDTETSGTTDPTVTLSDSDWAGNPSENEHILRDKVSAVGWEERYNFEFISWRNSDFTSSVTEPVSGNTVPKGWHLDGSMTYDGTNNRLTMQATGSGHAEQIFDEVLVKTSDNIDQFDVELTGEIEMTEGTGSSTIGVPVLEVTAWSTNSTEYMDEGKTWSTSTQYVKADVAEYTGTGSTFRSFDISLTGTAIDLSGPDDAEVFIRIRPTTTTADPDSDGEDEVGEIRWDSVTVGGLKRNVDRDREPMGSAASKFEVAGDSESETTIIGATWLNVNDPATANQSVENPAGAVRYKDSTSGDLLLPQDSDWTHATRSYSGPLEEIRLLDRYAQQSEDLLRVTGLVKEDAFNFGDTLSWRSSTWVPVMIQETPKEAYKKVTIVELKDVDTSSATINTTNGSFSSTAGGRAGAAGGGGGPSGTGVSSMQGRTGSVEFVAADDTDGTLTVDTTTDPNQLGIADAGVGTTQIAGSAVTNAKLANDTVTVAGNSVSLGGSTSVSVEDMDDVQDTTIADGGLLIGDNSNSEFKQNTISGGSNVTVTNTPGNISIDTDSVAQHDLSEHTNSSITGDVSTQDAGHIIHTDGSEWADSVTGQAGPSTNELPVWDGSKYTFQAVNSAQIATDAVGTSELDRSQSYTWTANHGFGGEGSPAYDIEAANDIAANGTIRDLSDARVKENLDVIEGALNRIPRGYTYDKYRTKDKEDFMGRKMGVVAQEIETHFPEAVDGRKGLKTVDHGALIGILFSAVVELRERAL